MRARIITTAALAARRLSAGKTAFRSASIAA